jgi:hypothetical protein
MLDVGSAAQGCEGQAVRRGAKDALTYLFGYLPVEVGYLRVGLAMFEDGQSHAKNARFVRQG